ncbi:MAG: signal peptidase I [Flavobacteriales bacterium]
MITGIIGGGFAALVVCFFAYARITGHLQFYVVPTAGCEPGIPRGAHVLASDWIAPKRFDIICYMHDLGDRKEVWLQRVCGLPGDTITMRAGRLSVNGQEADAAFSLKHRYRAHYSMKNRLVKQGDLHPDDHFPISSDSIAVFIIDASAERFGLKRLQGFIPDSVFHAPGWQEGELPETIVPEGHWFMLGDNRNASVDSRYIGFVAQSQFIGTVFRVIK